MINTNISIKLLIATLLVSTAANAQKLPNKQEISMLAPANIKIDGKATEWDNKFQAYNKATDLLYTLSNNDEILYLTIQVKDRAIIDKILRGGITLTINHNTNKIDKEAVLITYPVIRDNAASSILNLFANKSNQYREANKTAINVDALNKELDNRSKLINIAGIRSITDEAISVYNESNIKTASKFDENLNYTYELAVPLKYLTLPDKSANKFSYRIKLNEPAEMHLGTNEKLAPPVVILGPPPPPMIITSMSPTDFWGEYTLAKK